MSISTGPGRPEVASFTASWTMSGSISTSSTNQECLTIGIVIPVMSHSWNASVPRSFVRTWPVNANQRCRIHLRVRDRRQEIRRSWTQR